MDKKSRMAIAIDNDDDCAVQKLIDERWCFNIRMQNSCTPLLYAIMNKKEKCVECLFRNGAEISEREGTYSGHAQYQINQVDEGNMSLIIFRCMLKRLEEFHCYDAFIGLAFSMRHCDWKEGHEELKQYFKYLSEEDKQFPWIRDSL